VAFDSILGAAFSAKCRVAMLAIRYLFAYNRHFGDPKGATKTAVTKMKVKSFTYERNWTGKYYRQRLLPSMQTMDKHLASMLSNGWEIMTKASHSGNSRGFRPFAKCDTITITFRRAA